MEKNVFKKLLTAAWMVLVFACCQFAAAATTVTVSATPSNPTAPANVTLAVTANSDTGPVMATQVEYFSGTTSLGIALQAPFTLNVNDLAAGTYQITAKVTTTDPDNPVVQSQALALTVGAAPGAATAYFIHTDQLNTPRAITNANGTMVWQWDSDPFGKEPANEQPAGHPAFVFNLRFPGQQFDRESNLHYNYFRDYDPALGRYIESDPIGLKGGINTYAYVGGNPLNWVDPEGLEVLLCAQPAFGIASNPIDHHWIKTDTVEAGMGGTRGNVPGNDSGDLPGDRVQVTDHTGRSKEAGATCKKVDNVDEDKVNAQLKIGRPLGRWGPTNQCQSFAAEVLRNASTVPVPPIKTPRPGRE